MFSHKDHWRILHPFPRAAGLPPRAELTAPSAGVLTWGSPHLKHFPEEDTTDKAIVLTDKSLKLPITEKSLRRPLTLSETSLQHARPALSTERPLHCLLTARQARPVKGIEAEGQADTRARGLRKRTQTLRMPMQNINVKQP